MPIYDVFGFLGAIVTILGFICNILSRFILLRLQICFVDDLKCMRNRIMGYFFKTVLPIMDFKLSDHSSPVECRLINGGSAVKHVSVAGYAFHIGRVSTNDADVQNIENRDFSCMCAFAEKELYIQGHQSESFCLDYCRLIDFGTFEMNDVQRTCVFIGAELGHDIVVITLTYHGLSNAIFRKSSVYYDATAKKYIHVLDLCIIYAHALFHRFINLFRHDYDYIPDNAFTCFSVVCNGLANVCFDGKRALANCGDDDTSSFYKYFYDRKCFPSLCVCAASYDENPQRYNIFNRLCRVYGFNENGNPMSLCNYKFLYDERGLFAACDFRASSISELLRIFNFVTTCPPKTLVREYLQILLSEHVDFKILVTYDDIEAFSDEFGERLHIDGDMFDALFYVPFDFTVVDEHRAYRIYKHISHNGDRMIRVKNCCWVVPNYDNMEVQNHDSN